jgi:hypothetical protein
LLSKRTGLAVAVVLLLVLAAGCVNSPEQGEEVDNGQGHLEEPGKISENLEGEEGEEAPETPETAEVLEEKFLALEEEFFALFFRPETDVLGQVKDYDSKEALLDAVSEIAVREWVAPAVDEYYLEEDNKLFIIPQGMPPQLIPDQPYELRQINENTWAIVQEAENEMMGAYRLTVEFKKVDGRWLMSARRLEMRD